MERTEQSKELIRYLQRGIVIVYGQCAIESVWNLDMISSLSVTTPFVLSTHQSCNYSL